MSEILLKIDGKEVKAGEGMTIHDAAGGAGISIPTLCHHEKLSPYGACRICTVEVEAQGRTRLVAACVYPAEPGMVVTTRSEKVDRTRKVILEELLAHAPDSPELLSLAQTYGAEAGRFEKEPAFCILCGLCVRYCAEVKGKNAVGFSDRGPRREISFVPDVAARECWDCKECFSLCPTSYVQAVYVLTEALAFPGRSPETGSKK